MANTGYRTFNGTTDGFSANLGGVASSNSVPETWAFGGRLLATNADAEIVNSAGFTPTDWYHIAGPPNRFAFYDDVGPINATDGPTSSTTVDIILVARRASATAMRWSIATHNGSVWSAFTHTNSAATFVNHTYASSGVLQFAANLNARFAVIARCSASVSDGDVATLTSGLAAWQALPSVTSLWRFDQTPIVDLVGTSTSNTLTGTSVTASAFPLDDGASSVTGTVAQTLASVTSAASGTVTTPGGSVAVTLDLFTSTASGTFTPPAITGTVAVTLGSFTSNASGSGALILNDDFNGSSVDTTIWAVYNRIGDEENSEVNGVRPENVRVSSGTLKIDSKFEDYVIGDTDTTPITVHYTSGQIGQVTAPFQYGTVEVRAKIPGGTGLWPCIWMLGYEWQATQPYNANDDDANWPVDGWCEIDIAEFMNGARTDVNCALHWQTANAGGSGIRALGFDSTTQFAVYRLEWTPTSLTWSVDPEDGGGYNTLRTITGDAGDEIPDVPMWLMIHTAIGGVGGGTPNSATFPQTMEVDYARISKTADTLEITTGAVAATLGAFTPTASGTSAGPAELAIADLTITTVAETPTLTPIAILTGVADLTVGLAMDATTVQGVTTLVPLDLTVGVAAEVPTIGGITTLVAADLTVGLVADAVTLSVDDLPVDLTIANLTIAVTAEAVTLGGVTDLVIADLTVAVTASNITFGQTDTVPGTVRLLTVPPDGHYRRLPGQPRPKWLNSTPTVKDPDAVLDYPIDWGIWLEDGDELATLVATVTIHGTTPTAGTALTFVDDPVISTGGGPIARYVLFSLTGGVPGRWYAVRLHIETAQDDTDDRTRWVRVRNR